MTTYHPKPVENGAIPAGLNGIALANWIYTPTTLSAWEALASQSNVSGEPVFTTLPYKKHAAGVKDDCF